MSLTAMRRKMQYALPFVVWAFVIIFVIGAFSMFSFGGRPTRTGGGDDRFARINGVDVSAEQFATVLQGETEQAKMFASYGGQPITLAQSTEFPRYAYQRLLQEYAEAAAAEAAGINVSYGDAEAEKGRQINQHLETIGKGSTPEELSEMRAMMDARVDTDAVRRQLLSQKLREKANQEARPIEMQVAHILIKADKRTPEQALQLAQSLAAKARAGEDFTKLAQQYSEDEGSKSRGGLVGWASAQPPTNDPKKKPDPEAATSFVPEFTAASLRLKVGQVSDPVRSTFGFHVIKALKERNFQPTDKDSVKDPKKRDEAIQSYRSQLANQIVDGLVAAQKVRIESTVVPYSPWLKGMLAEQAAGPVIPPAPDDKSGKSKKSEQAQKLAPVIDAYAQALKTNDPAAGPALAYKLAQLYQQTGQDQEALAVLDKWVKRSGDADMYFLQGEELEKLNRKSDAVTAYQSAMDRAYNNPGVLMRISEKFKALGRSDLAKQASEKQAKMLARQAEERKRRDEEMKKRMAEATKAQTRVSTKGDAGKEEAPAQEITVKTGAIDPKTGKPTIESVTTSDGKPAKISIGEKSEPKKDSSPGK